MYKAGENVSIDETVKIINPENLIIGSNVRIDAYCLIIASSKITIGNNVHIGPFVQLAGSKNIFIDDYCGLSSRVSLFTATDDYTSGFLTNPTIPANFKNVKYGNITLEKHVIIGSGSVVLPGVTMKYGSASGALTLINKSIPECIVISGNPPVKVAKRDKNKLMQLEREFLNEIKAGNN